MSSIKKKRSLESFRIGPYCIDASSFMEKGDVHYGKFTYILFGFLCSYYSSTVLITSLPFDVRLYSIQLQITGVL